MIFISDEHNVTLLAGDVMLRKRDGAIIILLETYRTRTVYLPAAIECDGQMTSVTRVCAKTGDVAVTREQ